MCFVLLSAWLSLVSPRCSLPNYLSRSRQAWAMSPSCPLTPILLVQLPATFPDRHSLSWLLRHFRLTAGCRPETPFRHSGTAGGAWLKLIMSVSVVPSEPDDMKRGFQHAGATSNSGFMSFRPNRGTRIVGVGVPVWAESGLYGPGTWAASIMLSGIALERHERGIHALSAQAERGSPVTGVRCSRRRCRGCRSAIGTRHRD